MLESHKWIGCRRYCIVYCYEILFNLSINFSISSADTSINSTALLLHTNRESCGKYFNDLTRTIFEHHKFPIEEMFYILKEGRGTYEGDKPPVQTFEGRGETRFFVKRYLSKDA